MSLRTSIGQAATNKLAIWLQGYLPDVVVESRWPAPDRVRPAKSITILTAGKRRDLPVDARVVRKTSIGAAQTEALWQIAACTQPLQLDVWANSDVDRDDILARLDDYLHKGESTLDSARFPTPAGIGNLMTLGDGWEDSIADFVFEGPELEMTSDVVSRALYRATLRGNAYFMLTVKANSPRQAVINLKLRISESDSPTDITTPPIT